MKNILSKHSKNRTRALLSSALMVTTMATGGLLAVGLVSATDRPALAKEAPLTEQIYSFKAKALDGKDIDFSSYKGDVILIVNTASECGFTPQYEGLEALNKKFAAKGLKILGFPCNQFGAQEPGDSKTIATFCKKNYGVDFQMFEKIDVNGTNAVPLYQYLTKETGNAPIKWNFTKFLFDRKGHLVKRFDSAVTPQELSSDIEKLL